jgi:hypothetical protein
VAASSPGFCREARATELRQERQTLIAENRRLSEEIFNSKKKSLTCASLHCH